MTLAYDFIVYISQIMEMTSFNMIQNLENDNTFRHR